MNTTPTFTAAVIAAALDKAPCSIRRALEGVTHTSTVPTDYGEAKAWAFDVLPRVLRERLQAVARAGNFRDEIALLQHHCQSHADREQKLAALRDLWTLAADAAREKAVKLQRALLPALERYDAGELAGAELEQRGLDDYGREFGHKELSPRTWRFVFQRSRARARTPADYRLPHLFLDENCPRRRESLPALKFDDAFGPLHEMITAFHDPTAPTPKERETLWWKACKILQPHENDPRFRRALLNFLWNFAPDLATSQGALRVNLWRKLRDWKESFGHPTALRDGRLSKAGEQRATPFAQADLDIIIAHALFNCGARLAQAVRELRELGLTSDLSVEMLEYLGTEAQALTRDKWYVPARLRDAVRHELAILKPHHIGPRAADSESAWLKRDWSGVPAMYAITMDDVTLPVYFWIQDKHGKVVLTRGQCLVSVDCRSWRILSFSLQPDRNYNSRVIRTLITRTCSERGLPKIFYLECGIWKTSKLIKGNTRGAEMREAGEPFSWPECEHGLSEFGVKFIHAIRPRSKIVERVIGAMQALMEGEPGYCGREERKDRPEDLTKKMYAVEHGEDPAKCFYSFEQWEQRLGELCAKYNASRQDGEILAGLTPDAAFEKFADQQNPPEKFGPDCRYLLAHQKVSKVVGNNGITLQFGEKFVYRDAQTGPLRGQTVLCWFDPDAPEHLVVTDMKRKNPILVERAEKVLPFDDESDHFKHEIGKAKAHSASARARYRVLKVGFKEKFRHVVPDRAARVLGAQIENQQNERAEEKRGQENLRRKAFRLSERLGRSTALVPDVVTPDFIQGLEDQLETTESNTEN